MKQRKIGWFLLASISSVYAGEDTLKHSLKCNMIQIYEEEPSEVSNITDMFSQGIFYGRARTNSFGIRWDKEIQNQRKDNTVIAMGGSLIYRSATFKGFSVGTGLYTTYAEGSLSREDAGFYKAGKDTFNRYDFLTEGKSGVTSLAQAYIAYQYKDTSLKVGRQIYESFLTKSNDTKMIPNTFEGITLHNKSLPHTTIKMAYFTRQKLRDHSGFHHLLAYGDNASDAYASYTQNDDSAMHRGLKLSELKARGIEDRLVTLDITNHSLKNLTFYMNYTAVPELLSSAMFQADYRIEIGDWSIIPAIRVMQQFDNGAGIIAGANLKTLTSGYNNPESLDARLYATRVDVVKDAFKLRFAYSKIADKADIVAPWRGFPTGGFTRTMSQYNWYANTKSYMAQLDYTFESIPDCRLISRFAIQDFDDSKEGVQADSKVLTVDFLKIFSEKSIYFKTRYGHVVGDNNTIASNGIQKLNPSYDEIRFEINYLF